MARKWKSSLVLFSIVLALATVATAASVDDIQKTYSAFKDFDATFTQDTYQVILNKNVNFTGKIMFKRPDGVRMDVYKPQKQIIVLKDNKLVVMLPDEKKMAVQEVPKEIATQNLLAFVAGISSLDKEYNVKQEKDRIVLTPKKGAGEINIWANGGNIITRVKLVDSMGNKSDISLSDYRFNMGLKDDVFKIPEVNSQTDKKK